MAVEEARCQCSILDVLKLLGLHSTVAGHLPHSRVTLPLSVLQGFWHHASHVSESCMWAALCGGGGGGRRADRIARPQVLTTTLQVSDCISIHVTRNTALVPTA